MNSRSFHVAGVLCMILVVHALVAIQSLHQQSVTVDEFAHLPAGISCLQRRTFFVFRVNPPLCRMLAALPVLCANPVMTYKDNFVASPGGRYEWTLARQFAQDNREHYFDLFNLGRYCSVVLSMMACVVICRWASELYGDRAGLLAAFFWAACPMVLGNMLITSEMGSAAMCVLACYACSKWLQGPTWTMTVLTGVDAAEAASPPYAGLKLRNALYCPSGANPGTMLSRNSAALAPCVTNR